MRILFGILLFLVSCAAQPVEIQKSEEILQLEHELQLAQDEIKRLGPEAFATYARIIRFKRVIAECPKMLDTSIEEIWEYLQAKERAADVLEDLFIESIVEGKENQQYLHESGKYRDQIKAARDEVTKYVLDREWICNEKQQVQQAPQGAFFL